MKVVAVKAPGGLDKLVIESSAEPVAKPGQILVRVFASSLNFHDLAVVSGRIKTDDGRIPMSDGAGEVVDVGEGVGTVWEGRPCALLVSSRTRISGGPTRERLMGVPGDGADGFAAEYVAMPAETFTRSAGRGGASRRQAATSPGAALTAWRAPDGRGADQAGRRRADPGHPGGVSIFAVQFAKAAGATVIATSSSDEKLARLKALGADHLIN